MNKPQFALWCFNGWVKIQNLRTCERFASADTVGLGPGCSQSAAFKPTDAEQTDAKTVNWEDPERIWKLSPVRNLEQSHKEVCFTLEKRGPNKFKESGQRKVKNPTSSSFYFCLFEDLSSAGVCPERKFSSWFHQDFTPASSPRRTRSRFVDLEVPVVHWPADIPTWRRTCGGKWNDGRSQKTELLSEIPEQSQALGCVQDSTVRSNISVSRVSNVPHSCHHFLRSWICDLPRLSDPQTVSKAKISAC